MISVHVNHMGRYCNICMAKAHLEVFFRSNFNHQGTIIALCDNCAKDLCVKIKEEQHENE